MADLNESTIKGIVQHEMRGLHQEINQLRHKVDSYETYFRDIHRMQQDMHRMIPDMDRLLQQTRELSGVQQVVQQLRVFIEDIAMRTRELEKGNDLTTAYISARVRERAERGLSA